MFESGLNTLDEQLAAFAPAEAALRLRLGQVLEVLSRGAHLELGFSSMAAYAAERCERSARWAEAARCLARRLEGLPVLRRSVAEGRLSWSKAELVARVARPQNEESWLLTAAAHTVRQMRALVNEASHSVGHDVEVGDAEGTSDVDGLESEEACVLSFTVEREEAWLFEATCNLLQHLGADTLPGGGTGAEAQIEALLAEGQETLFRELSASTLDADRLLVMNDAQRRWREELRRWTSEAEARCERRIRATAWEGGGTQSAVAAAAALGCASFEGATSGELDRAARDLAGALARQELELSQLILRFHRVNGWRRLGYANEGQYARERLGISRSSLVARRALGARLERLPRVAEALGVGLIGVEAALQIVRVATQDTEVSWIERARARTIKHLREEVGAALVAVRVSGEADCSPPAQAELLAFQELERAVVSGRVCQEKPEPVGQPEHDGRGAWQVMLASLARWLEQGIQMSAGGAKAPSSRKNLGLGRVRLRVRVSRETFAWWHELESQARRWLPAGMSWVRFLCLSMWRAWSHTLGRDVPYHDVYVRDRERCTSPVCDRKDVTPHHLEFRSAGGSDDDENVVAVCTWCHLCGLHGGRIRAVGTAQCVRWELGPSGHPCVIVQGRQRIAA